jgi:hypothetical protein
VYNSIDQQWQSAVSEATSILQQIAAADPGLITYGELSNRITTTRIEPFGSEMNRLLTDVSTEENAAGRPLLSSIVVRQDTMQPGAGFETLARSLGFVFSDSDAFWLQELTRTQNYWREQLRLSAG